MSSRDSELAQAIKRLEAYRAELIKQGQANATAKEYVRVVADNLGAILRPLYD